jgi:hypothetical protein
MTTRTVQAAIARPPATTAASRTDVACDVGEAAAARLIQLALKCLDGAAQHGDGAARHAAAVLRGRAPEHVGIDDGALLVEVDQIGGRKAIAIVARRHGRSLHEIQAIARRLRRKRRKTDMTAYPLPNR